MAADHNCFDELGYFLTCLSAFWVVISFLPSGQECEGNPSHDRAEGAGDSAHQGHARWGCKHQVANLKLKTLLHPTRFIGPFRC